MSLEVAQLDTYNDSFIREHENILTLNRPVKMWEAVMCCHLHGILSAPFLSDCRKLRLHLCNFTSFSLRVSAALLRLVRVPYFLQKRVYLNLIFHTELMGFRTSSIVRVLKN
jgi:hypothetical protein